MNEVKEMYEIAKELIADLGYCEESLYCEYNYCFTDAKELNDRNNELSELANRLDILYKSIIEREIKNKS